jgi:hypothetical protein
MVTQTSAPDPALRFQRIPGVDPASGSWEASHQVLSRLIWRDRRKLAHAVAVARTIRRELEHLLPVIEALSRATCPGCPDPCCRVTKGCYDFTDLLFLHLIAVPLPPAPVADTITAPCRYLSSRGCLLSRLIRPWGCLQYTCPTQRRYMRLYCPLAGAYLDRGFHKIKAYRHQLAAEFERSVVAQRADASASRPNSHLTQS